MRHLITGIDTFLKDRELFVSIEIENELEPVMKTSFKSLIHNVGQISIFELDILEGCHLEPNSFYKHGDKMSNGKVAYDENRFPKDWKITYSGTLNDLRTRNCSKLLVFKNIYNVEIPAKNSVEPYLIVKTTDNNLYPYKIALFKSLVGINENEFPLLNGAFISPVWYKKGETSLYNGRFTTVTQDNKLIKTFNIRIESTIENHHKLYGDQQLKNDIYSGNGRYEGDDDDDDSYESSYKKYNGYNDFDDDAIDNAFEGDPEATWNVD